jgi:hypothetical protein
MVRRGAEGGWRGGLEGAGVGRKGEEGRQREEEAAMMMRGREEAEGREWNVARV